MTSHQICNRSSYKTEGDLPYFDLIRLELKQSQQGDFFYLPYIMKQDCTKGQLGQ